MKKQKVEQKPSELLVEKDQIDRRESGLNNQPAAEAEVIRVQKA